jgi:hypothetical protein
MLEKASSFMYFQNRHIRREHNTQNKTKSIPANKRYSSNIEETPPQVVSEFLTPDDDARLLMRAQGRPTVVYTYRMALRRAAPVGAATAAAASAPLGG